MVIICWSYLASTQVLCFRGSFLWIKTPNKFKNLNSFEELKSEIKQWYATTCSCKICKWTNFIIFCKGSSLDYADGVGCVWVDDLTSAAPESSENHRFSDGFREGAKFNWFAWTHLILDTKCCNGFPTFIDRLFVSLLVIKNFSISSKPTINKDK